MLGQIAPRRDATVITLIHRQETISLLGFPRSEVPAGSTSSSQRRPT